MSRKKYFEFESLETKGWNLKKFTDPKEWINFVSLQEHTYEDLVREFYTNLSAKQKKNENENFLISFIKGVQITITQDFLSEALKIPNEGNKVFSYSWYNDARVDRNQLIIKYTKENHTFNSTNLEDVPKILHNMVRSTLVPKCGSFDVVSDMDLCIIHHLITKTKLNICFLIIQHMIDSCLAIKQSVAGLPYGMHLTSIFQKANIPLEGEKRKLDFMKFTSKNLGQLRITTSNMPTFTTSGSAKRLSNQNVQKTRKKRKTSLSISCRTILSSLQAWKGDFSRRKLSVQSSAWRRNAQKVDDASIQEEAEIAKQAIEVHEVIPQAAKENSVDQNKRLEENTEYDTQNVNDDTQEVAELLASNMSIEEEVQEEQMDFSTGFDLNVEDINTDFNNEVSQEDKETAQVVQETFAAQNVETTAAHNVEVSKAQNVEDVQIMANQDDQELDDQHASNEPLQGGQLSADPAPLASGSLPSIEVQLMAQTAQNVNLSSSTMGSVVGASNFLVSDLPTPNTIPSYTPQPPQIKTTTTSKLPNMSAFFDSLNTFVIANIEKVEPSGVAPPAKTSRAEKRASKALRVSAKTHKIVCALADWTVKVHAPGLAISPPIFDDPSLFEAEPSSDSGDSTP
ncbi:hypothetical protein MTR_0043s0140 [Medicago truncatula]|uniref:Putative plant transposon protein domain-containing protein n=1 Tax=Medicago truncatula TaxID=3880 RepID=A0A072TU74_MEDTR|nr:hypothetical protein MTR_0043s0140 [Medicago truncatula]